MNEYKNLINGNWVAGKTTHELINPSNVYEIVGRYGEADTEQVNDAVYAASKALIPWAKTSVKARQNKMRKIAKEIKVRAEELVTLISRETGKTKSESRHEVIRAMQAFTFFADENLCLDTERSFERRVGVETMRLPLGVIGLDTYWSDPFATPALKIATTMVLGNTVVLNPDELAPGIACALADIINRSGIPPGVFNLVMGFGSTMNMSGHPDIHMFNMWSMQSPQGARNARLSNSLTAEQQSLNLGSCIQIVLDDADVSRAVDLSIRAAFYSSSYQSFSPVRACRLVVTEGIYTQFMKAFTARVSEIKVGDALDPYTELGPVISQAHLQHQIETVVAAQKCSGATLVTGGGIVACHTFSGNEGYFMAPTVLADLPPDNVGGIGHEFLFPVTTVKQVRDYEEALAYANSRYNISKVSIATASNSRATHFKRNSNTCIVMVNLPTFGMDYGPGAYYRIARDLFSESKVVFTNA